MIVHDREEWLAGYEVADGEGSAWWGGFTFPDPADITNITWHYPGGAVDPNASAAELRTMQAGYHRRTDGGENGRPWPFTLGYDLGYNATIDPAGDVWKVRWFDKRCAANGSSSANAISFAVQFMVPAVDADLTPAQIESARWLDRYLRNFFRNMPAGVRGHTRHSDWFPTACPGAPIGAHVLAGDLLWRPPILGEEKMQIRWRDTRFANVFILPDGGTVGPAGAVAFGALQLVEEQHDATLADACYKAWGVDPNTAEARGLLVRMPA